MSITERWLFTIDPHLVLFACTCVSIYLRHGGTLPNMTSLIYQISQLENCSGTFHSFRSTQSKVLNLQMW